MMHTADEVAPVTFDAEPGAHRVQLAARGDDE
jgi:hypothetical protein